LKPSVANANRSNGDFDYNGFVDDDVTPLAPLYNSGAAGNCPVAVGGLTVLN